MSKTPEAFVASQPTKLQPVVSALQVELLKICPKFTVAPAWKGLAFKREENYSCMIAPYSDHIKLMIWRGVDLEDPEGRLQGSGKNTKHLKISKESDINVPYLKMLFKQQFALYDSGVPWEEKCEVRKAREMPEFVELALKREKLLDAFEKRPPYQKRDYIFWISEAKREATAQKRLEQMLSELEAGDMYMKMSWGRKKGND